VGTLVDNGNFITGVLFGIIFFIVLIVPVEEIIHHVEVVTPLELDHVREDGERAGEEPPPEVELLEDDDGGIYDHPPPHPLPPDGPHPDGGFETVTEREMVVLIFPAISAFL